MTDEQRSSRPIFNATLWAAASWLFFFRRDGSTVMIQIAALRSTFSLQIADGLHANSIGEGSRDYHRDPTFRTALDEPEIRTSSTKTGCAPAPSVILPIF